MKAGTAVTVLVRFDTGRMGYRIGMAWHGEAVPALVLEGDEKLTRSASLFA